MFSSLVRRISGSFLPRSDRPWPEDATSTAPTIGRKRRLSTPPDEEQENIAKRARGHDGAEVCEVSPTQESVKETEEVNEVTQGVKEVELGDAKPETIPLPATPPSETLELDSSPVVATEEQGVSTVEDIPIDAKSTSEIPTAVAESAADEQDASEPVADTEALTAKNPVLFTPSASTTDEPASEIAAKITDEHQSNAQISGQATTADETEKVAEVEQVEESAL